MQRSGLLVGWIASKTGRSAETTPQLFRVTSGAFALVALIASGKVILAPPFFLSLALGLICLACDYNILNSLLFVNKDYGVELHKT